MKTLVIFSILFSSIVFASIKSPKSYCSKLKTGQPFQIDREKEALEAEGLKAEIAIAGEAGHDTKMLMISQTGMKQKCDVVVRDGKIAEIRQ